LTHFIKFKVWGIAAAGLLIIVTGATAASRGATEGVTRTGAPRWVSLFGVAILPDNTIFVVGSKALLLISSDKGKTWLQRIVKEREGSELFQDRDLYAIRFSPGGKVGWIVGEEGVILKTADGGDTWTRQDSGVKSNLFNLCPVDNKVVVAVGADGTIVRTGDGGDHWRVLKSPKLVSLFDLTFVNQNVGFAVGEFSTILATADGGETWMLNHGGNTDDFTIGPYFSVIFSDPLHGIVSGLAGDLMVTADGGKTWQARKLPDSASGYVVAEESSSKRLWIAGVGGRMFNEAQDGQWQSVERTAFHDITDLAFAGELGVAVGLNGTILLSDNAGAQWRAVP
jgi:photosystem II stability/assembly factor-like uncharacterized protein